MARDIHANRRLDRRLVGSWLAFALTCQAVGCANLWDDVTSRDFKVRSLFTRDDPMTVLATSSDGDERARAIRALKEPKSGGGGAVEQDQVVEVLSKAATAEPQPLVRIAAIETLGKFKDPRAVPALTRAYESANQLTGDAAATVRCLALQSLGETRQPEALKYLTRVAQTPAPAEMSDRDRQQARDCRLAALRGLGNFEGSQEVGSSMVRLLQTERDVAVRDRAREAYVAVAGIEPPMTQPPQNLDAPTPTPNDVRLTGASQPIP